MSVRKRAQTIATYETRVNFGAERGLALLTVQAVAACDIKWHNDTVALLQELH